MTNQITETILNLREEIIKYAQLIDPKPHTHTVDDLEDVEGGLVPTNHAWDKNNLDVNYGLANSEQYGHVAISSVFTSDDAIDTPEYERNKNNAVSENAVRNYFAEYIDNQFGIFCLDAEGNLWIDTININADMEAQIREIVSDYDINGKLEKHVITNPKSTNATIDNIIENGYYYLNPNNNTSYIFSCNNDVIHYERAFIIVKKQGTSIIQYVYATKPNSLGTYQLTGEIYTRIGAVNNNDISWNASWNVFYKPYQNRSQPEDLIDELNITGLEIYENTNGFIFKWNQAQYILQKDSGIWETICTFTHPLPIEDNFIFSNIINNTDIRISSTKMEIRSKQRKDTTINDINETHFIPRKY